MKKILLTVASLSLLGLSFGPVLAVDGRENISPIESVEWIGGQEAESSPEEDLSLEEETGLEESSFEEETTVEESEATEEEVNTSEPAAFVSDLSQADLKMIEYVSFATLGEEFELTSINMLRDQNKFYSARMTPPFLPQAKFFSSEDGQSIDQAYMSIDDLIKYAADSLNTQPQIYEGTVVEDFYVFSQEHFAEMEGRVVLLEDFEDIVLEDSLLLTQIESFITDVAVDWLSEESVQNAVMETELGLQYTINEENGLLFNEIADRYEADYPDLAEIFALYEEGYEGTMTIDYESGQFGIGLLYNSSEELLSGLELYIRQSDAGIIDFTEEIIYDYDAFVEFVGFDVIAEFQALEASLTADMFVNELE